MSEVPQGYPIYVQVEPILWDFVPLPPQVGGQFIACRACGAAVVVWPHDFGNKLTHERWHQRIGA